MHRYCSEKWRNDILHLAEMVWVSTTSISSYGKSVNKGNVNIFHDEDAADVLLDELFLF